MAIYTWAAPPAALPARPPLLFLHSGCRTACKVTTGWLHSYLSGASCLCIRLGEIEREQRETGRENRKIMRGRGVEERGRDRWIKFIDEY